MQSHPWLHAPPAALHCLRSSSLPQDPHSCRVGSGGTRVPLPCTIKVSWSGLRNRGARVVGWGLALVFLPKSCPTSNLLHRKLPQWAVFLLGVLVFPAGCWAEDGWNVWLPWRPLFPCRLVWLRMAGATRFLEVFSSWCCCLVGYSPLPSDLLGHQPCQSPRRLLLVSLQLPGAWPKDQSKLGL